MQNKNEIDLSFCYLRFSIRNIIKCVSSRDVMRYRLIIFIGGSRRKKKSGGGSSMLQCCLFPGYKCIDLVFRRSNRDEDKTSLTTLTSTVQDSILSAQSQSIRSIYERRDFGNQALQRSGGGGRVFSYRKKKTRIGNGIFSAPAGVNPHHVASSIVKRNTGGSRLIFIWPQKTRTRGRLWTILAPLMHGILIGLLCMDAVHLWPGEFLPTSLPSTSRIPLPPVKCNIIEPCWFDNT